MQYSSQQFSRRVIAFSERYESAPNDLPAYSYLLFQPSEYAMSFTVNPSEDVGDQAVVYWVCCL